MLVTHASCLFLKQKGKEVSAEEEAFRSSEKLDAYIPHTIVPGYDEPITFCREIVPTSPLFSIKEEDYQQTALSIVQQWGEEERVNDNNAKSIEIPKEIERNERMDVERPCSNVCQGALLGSHVLEEEKDLVTSVSGEML